MTRFSDLLGRDGQDTEDVASDAMDDAASPVATDLAPPSALTPAAEPPPLAEPGDEPTTTQEPVGRDVFAELAAEQVVQAERADEATERLRALGLEALPLVDDDFLPRR